MFPNKDIAELGSFGNERHSENHVLPLRPILQTEKNRQPLSLRKKSVDTSNKKRFPHPIMNGTATSGEFKMIDLHELVKKQTLSKMPLTIINDTSRSSLVASKKRQK